MTSTNFLTVKTHVSEFKTNSDKDTISEASGSGTSNSVTSSEDLQKLAVILGLNSVEDVHQERFRVDRRRLEAMLADHLDESQTAQAFFHRVMNDTNTLINWPARLKIGARSKKDPHVRVAGRADDVRIARDKIMQLLDTRSNRVTMKIDVSYTDHSHIIGKGGLTIKRVMEETGCHIHFPDSNRTSAQEKSNQVSIAGDMERVERARARVRALTPLVFCFELPIAQAQPDIHSPYVQKVQDQYNVQVMLRNRPKLHAHLLVVKGVQWEVQATMEATKMLMNFMCGQLATQTQVQMSLEISPMLHSAVIGRGAEQLMVIMRNTATQIMFPDANDPNIPALRKSCVTITGQIKDVYAARQQLVGSLPLVLIFDVPEECCSSEGEATARIMKKHRVNISVRHKPKQGIASVVIKGIERCAGDIYEARRDLLGGAELSVNAEIPESYSIPSLSTLSEFGVYNPFSPTAGGGGMGNSPRSTYNLQLATDLANYGSPMYGHNPPTPGGYPAPMSPLAVTPPMFPGWLIPSPQPRPGPFQFPGITPTPGPIVYKAQGVWNPMSNTTDVPSCMQMSHDPRHMLNSSSQGSSGYQSNFTGSSVSLDTQNISGGDCISSNVGSPSVSPISKLHSPATSTDTAERTQHDLANIISELSMSDRRAVGCEKKTLATLKMSPPSEYRKLQAEANKAMHESIGSGYRVPTGRWSGYNFSHTSPGPLNLKDDSGSTPEKPWNRPELSRPNVMVTESTPSPRAPPADACHSRRLYELMRETGLAKYIELFEKHELDMSTFASLSDADLLEIGVTAFGARRKMLLLISNLRERHSDKYKVTAGANDAKMINSPLQYNNAALAQDKW